MVSSPSYDPNRLASHNLGRVQDSWEQLQDHPGEPMLNRTIQDVYPPGSTFKLVTAAAALSSGQYTPESTVPGGFQLEFPAGEPIPNDGGGNCGGQRISLTQALMVSCNVSFGHIGVQLGADTLQEQAQKFGFGERYLEDLNGQVASRFPEELEEDVFVAQSAIGQFDVAATPLQMAMVTAGIANGGTVMKPYLVDEVRSPDLEPLEKTTPEPFRTAVSADVARDLTQMMIEVVDQGTATPAQIPGMKVAGKTGTAQSSPSRPPYAWFVSFAPADNPQVAVAVLVEDAGVERDAISGSGLAAPIAKRVMEAVINR
jgi:peptidoglycan glycosyltransferase